MGSKKAEHAEALELIGYGLAKFAGPQKGRNEIANRLAKNRNAFFQRLVDVGMATSKNAVSNRQDNYDSFFGTKNGYKGKNRLAVYGPRKKRLDSVIGHLDLNQYVDFIEAIIASETGVAVDEKMLQLINAAKLALSDDKSVLDPPDIAVVEVENPTETSEEPKSENDALESTRIHTEVQWILKQLGILAGCKVFIAINDRSTIFKGEPLGQNCIEKLPNKGMSKSVYKRSSLIDVVWVKNKKIVNAFEVECSTTIYSGILRISDLAYELYDSVKGIIVVPDARKGNVIEQLERPTFSTENIADNIGYLTIEELNAMYKSLVQGGLKQPGSLTIDSLWKNAHFVEGEE